MKRHNNEQWTFQDDSVKQGRIKHLNPSHFICTFISNGYGIQQTWFLAYVSVLKLEITYQIRAVADSL